MTSAGVTGAKSESESAACGCSKSKGEVDRKKKPENLPMVVIMKVRVVPQEEMSAGVI